jgi:hypothetical protein
MPTAHEVPTSEVEDPRFETRLDPRWALSLEQLAAVALFGVLFVMLSVVPLRANDLWVHVTYGQWMLDHRAIPTEDPSMPLARGMQVVDGAWLSQLLLGAVDRYLGPEAISDTFAILAIVTYLLWARVFYLQSQRVWLSLFSMLLLIFVGWSRLTTVRPESFAMLCGALLFLVIARRQTSPAKGFDWAAWIGVPVLFALWANLHGSFVVGLVILACMLIGRVIEVLWQQRSLLAPLRDVEARQWLYLTELALFATLLNPYGVDLWIYTIRFSSNPNLATVSEWQPLVILGTGGRQFAISLLLLLVVWRHSRRPIRPYEVLLLLVFAGAAIGGIRMIGWYAPVFAFVITPHLAEIAASLWPKREQVAADETASPAADAEGTATKVPLPGHSFRYSLVALLLIWIAFAFSPVSRVVFRNRPPRTPEQLYGASTPVALTKYLNEPPAESPLARAEQWDSQVFHPQWWGDWLDRSGPEGLQPFVTTNIHLVPRQVWNDYNRVLLVQSGWERTLDRYHVGTIIVDKKEQRPLFSTLQRHTDWQNVYEDEQAAVFLLRTQRTRESQNAETPAEETT